MVDDSGVATRRIVAGIMGLTYEWFVHRKAVDAFKTLLVEQREAIEDLLQDQHARVDVRQQDGCACLGQAAGGGEAETLCGPGDHGDAALEIEQVGDRPVRIGVWRRPCRHRR